MPRQSSDSSSVDDEMLKHLDLLLSYDALEEEAAWDLIADPDTGPATEVDDDEPPHDADDETSAKKVTDKHAAQTEETSDKHSSKKTGGHR